MSIETCGLIIDNTGRELIEHGSSAFPMACYYDDLNENEVPWHWHEELEIGILLEGEACLCAGNEKYTLHPGEGFFINTGILHGIWDQTSSPCLLRSIVFHPRLVGGNMDSIFFQNYVQPLLENSSSKSLILTPSIPWQKAALEAFSNTWQHCIEEPAGYEFKVRNELSEFIFLLQDHLTSTVPPVSKKTICDGKRIKEMLRFIHDHISEPLTITQIANTVSISESECLRCFKSTIRTTPIQYVRQYRIQRACQLLKSTQIPITEIALMCGFQDLSYFTKTFKESKNVTPTQFRSHSFL